jgi:pyruvate/2-oxoglutarate dehydrogenase complex dihydrolipoamide acyltransferase (E2) component
MGKVGFGIQRKVIAYSTLQSWKNVPHVSYVYEPDMTEFHDSFLLLRARIAQEHPEVPRVTFNTVILKAIAEGLQAAPSLNARFSYNSFFQDGRLDLLPSVDITVPWLLEDSSFITAVIPAVNQKTLLELSTSMEDLKRRLANTNLQELYGRIVIADTLHKLKRLDLSVLKRLVTIFLGRAGLARLRGEAKRQYYAIPPADRLEEKDINSGSVVVSNIGSLDKDQRGHFALLDVISPNVFAVGVGAVQKKPLVYIGPDGTEKIGIRKMLPMCLVFDHRAVDFSALVPFMKRMNDIFDNAAPGAGLGSWVEHQVHKEPRAGG